MKRSQIPVQLHKIEQSITLTSLIKNTRTLDEMKKTLDLVKKHQEWHHRSLCYECDPDPVLNF